MKLMIEIMFLHDQYYRRGIGRYGREMVAAMLEHFVKEGNNDQMILLGFSSLERNLELLELSDEVRELVGAELNNRLTFVSFGKPRLSTPIFNIWNYYRRIVPAVKKFRPDKYFAAHFDRGLPSKLVPVFVAIHDAIPLITGQFSSKGRFTNLLKGIFYRFMWRGVRLAKVVFTSSEVSKLDIVLYGGLSSGNVEVVHLGISKIFLDHEIASNKVMRDEALRRLLPEGEATDYFIYDAGFEGNKNTTRLLEVFATLVQLYPKVRLVVTGGDFVDGRPVSENAKNFTDTARRLEVASRIIPVGRVSEEDLVLLLAGAILYLNLSDYEGFGFGPLQAMAAGVPAAIACNACFQEISGPGALLLDTENISESCNKIIELLGTQSVLNKQVAAGKLQAAKFTWEKCFNKTWEIIENWK